MTRLSLLLLATAVQPAFGHLNSYDTYLDGVAGPYRLSITVRNPEVIPGVAQIEARTSGTGVKSIQIVPVPLAGAAAKFYPAPDTMTRSPGDPGFFSGSPNIEKNSACLRAGAFGCDLAIGAFGRVEIA